MATAIARAPGALLLVGALACGAAPATPTPEVVAATPTPEVIAAPAPEVIAPPASTTPPIAAPIADAPVTAAEEPAIAAPVADAGSPGLDEPEALRRLLGDGDADVVEIVERHEIGREALVLYRWYGARAWRAKQRRAGTLAAAEAEIAAKVDACEDADGIESVCLVEGGIGDPWLAWTTAQAEVFAWEVARVRAGATVLARLRLFELTLAVADLPHKFKVYDVDGDGRSELTVVVPVALPNHYAGMESEDGEVGFILEAADLHVQFSATRSHAARWQDVGSGERTAETVWLARDVDADGHADLQVRETTREQQDGGEGEPASPARTTSRKTVCPYEVAADVWRCPEALGRQLFPAPTP